jgi:predicted RNA-binding Zn-ribbon protein involved in translation (DUF1610 family)
MYKKKTIKRKVVIGHSVEYHCPKCGSKIYADKKNHPKADFYCIGCRQEYKIKK